MFPLSFKEFLSFYEFSTSVTVEEKFQRYLQFGGMPILKEYQFNEARINQALEGIYSTVILRDILQRNNQTDQGMLQKLIMFLCSNIGSITSPNSIGNVLSNEGDIPTVKGRNIVNILVRQVLPQLSVLYILISLNM